MDHGTVVRYDCAYSYVESFTVSLVLQTSCKPTPARTYVVESFVHVLRLARSLAIWYRANIAEEILDY